MVRLSKIYTKTGDAGDTGLGDGARVPKTDPRVEAYGTVDEANAFVGMCVCACQPRDPLHARVRALLLLVQNDLFDVGADLCCPQAKGEAPGAKLRVVAAQSQRLEKAIDEFNEPLAPLNSFVLPGGSPLAAALHAARTVVRRAERRVLSLLQADPARTSNEALIYLNRLSDLLFVLARASNGDGAQDVLWKPGANR